MARTGAFRQAAQGLGMVLAAGLAACGAPDFGAIVDTDRRPMHIGQTRSWVIRDPSGRPIGQGMMSQSGGPGGQSSMMWSSSGGGPMTSIQQGPPSGQGAYYGSWGGMQPQDYSYSYGYGPHQGIQSSQSGMVFGGGYGYPGGIQQSVGTNQQGYVQGWTGPQSGGQVSQQFLSLGGSGISQSSGTDQSAANPNW